MDGYLERLVDPWIGELLASAPAVMITGPRAVGKTTTALRHAAGVVLLDREREAVPFRADPDAALRDRPEPVLLDEWQECPGVLGAVKRAVDTERRPGRYILTGSVRSDTDPRLWPGPGAVRHAGDGIGLHRPHQAHAPHRRPALRPGAQAGVHPQRQGRAHRVQRADRHRGRSSNQASAPPWRRRRRPSSRTAPRSSSATGDRASTTTSSSTCSDAAGRC